MAAAISASITAVWICLGRLAVQYWSDANSVVVQAVNEGVLPVFSYVSMGANTIQFTNLSRRATSYQWDFGDGSTSTEVNPSHIFHSGTYDVKLTASNLCNSASTTQSLIVAPGPVYIPIVIK
jgi:PKD repeat protein